MPKLDFLFEERGGERERDVCERKRERRTLRHRLKPTNLETPTEALRAAGAVAVAPIDCREGPLGCPAVGAASLLVCCGC
jgi:hypothetical protein